MATLHPLSEQDLIGGACWIDLERFSDPRGSLTPVEGGRHVPFEVRRLFYFYDVPVGENRGAHAHRDQEQLIICLAGGFDVVLDDGSQHRTARLSRPWRGLYVPHMLWAAQVNFDGG